MTSDSTKKDLAELAKSAVVFPAESALIELTGADRRDWLQGQVTQDLRLLQTWGALQSCLCTPTGHLLADLFLWDLEDRILIGVDPACAAAVLKRVEDMVIMEDVVAKRLDLPLVSIQGPHAGDYLEGAHLALSRDRSGFGGFDVWGLPESNPPRQISQEASEIARIEAGIPRFGVDMGDRTLPPEMGPAFEKSRISYTKGCYTGQEVLMRIHSRGHTNKTWVGLTLGSPVQAGETVGESGVVTSACVSPEFGPIALALLRNETAAEGSVVQVGKVNGTVKALPFR